MFYRTSHHKDINFEAFVTRINSSINIKEQCTLLLTLKTILRFILLLLLYSRYLADIDAGKVFYCNGRKLRTMKLMLETPLESILPCTLYIVYPHLMKSAHIQNLRHNGIFDSFSHP